MREDDPRFRGRNNSGLSPETILRAIRFIGLFAGILMLLVGVFCLLRVFGGVYSAINHPTDLKPLVEQWSEVIDGSQLAITINEEKMPFGKVLSVLILGFGAIILTHAALALITSGTRIVLVCVDEKSEFRQKLKHLGSNKRDGADSSESSNQSS